MRLAGSRVLGESKQLVAGAFDDDVNVADDDHRGRFEFLAGDRDRRHAWAFDGNVHLVGQAEIFLEAGDVVFPGLVRIDEGDVERLDTRCQVHLPEVVDHVDPVHFHRDFFDVPRRDSDTGFLVRLEFPLGDDLKLLRREIVNPLLCLARVLSRDLFVRLQRFRQLPELIFACGADCERGARRLLGVRIFFDKLLQVGDRFLKQLLSFCFRRQWLCEDGSVGLCRLDFFLPLSDALAGFHVAEQEQNLRRSAIERILVEKRQPQSSRCVVVLFQ